MMAASISLGLVGVVETRVAAQTLSAVRQEVYSTDSSSLADSLGQTNQTPRHGNDLRYGFRSNLDDDDDDSETTLADIGWQLTFASARWIFIGDGGWHGLDGPRGVGQEDGGQDESLGYAPTVYFSQYPYADGNVGYAMSSDDLPASPSIASWQSRFAYGADFDDLSWYTAKSSLESSRARWGIDGEWTLLRERLSSGSMDEAHVGDLNITWRRLQTQQWLLRWGAGVGWYHDSLGTRAGFNGTLRADWFPRDPIVVSAEYDLGQLGGATAQHLALTIGAQWRHIELFSAYDYRRFNDVEIAGPMFGIRCWF
ncbi:MAG: hypothetical protein KDA83_16470 [Planctomycetales bacterium]|nr:hypothetical protein [Planctomycetales bacterium]